MADIANEELIANTVVQHNQLLEYVRAHSTGTADYHVTANGGPFLGQKARFEESRIIEFFDRCDAARRAGCWEHYLERTTDGPRGLMIDIDRKQVDSRNSIFTIATIANGAKNLAHILRNVIISDSEQTKKRRDIFDEMDDLSEAAAATSAVTRHSFHIFVIKRRRISAIPACEGQYKDGLHYLVPEIWMEKKDRERVIDMFRRQYVTAFTDATRAGMSNDEIKRMVDKSSAHVPPFLLGSCKPGGMLYDLVYAAEISWTNMDDTVSIVPLSTDLLTKEGLTAPIDEGGRAINLAYEISLSFRMETYHGMPAWLHKRDIQVTDGTRTRIDALCARIAALDESLPSAHVEHNYETALNNLIAGDNDAAYLRDLLSALPEVWAREYAKWFNVLAAISHEACRVRRVEEYVILAEYFSRRGGDKWSEQGFRQAWNSLVARGRSMHRDARVITIHSLESFVATENREAYDIARRGHASSALRSAIFASAGILDHKTVADILYLLVGAHVAIDPDAADIQSRENWYEFVTPQTDQARDGEIYKWRSTTVPALMRRAMDADIIPMLADICNTLNAEIARADMEESRRKKCIEIRRALLSSIRACRSMTFWNNVVKMAVIVFRRVDFAKNLDTDLYVIGVGNGVLEIAHRDSARESREVVFAPRLIREIHEYRVSKFTPVEYIPYNAGDARICEILRAYRDIYIEPDVCEFMLLYLSTWLDFCSTQRIIVLLGGGGSNGKTWSVYFPQMVLGANYVKTLRMQLLTDAARESGRDANSALMQLNGLRGGYFDEAKEGDGLNPARLKTIVTPGMQTGRELYSREQQFQNTANTIAISNYDFEIDSSDQGTWDRVRFYKCKMRFVSEPNPANRYERVANRQMTNDWIRDPEYLRAMLSILVHYRVRLHNEYGDDIRAVPHATIIEETRKFREKQDPISKFVREHFVISPNNEESLNSIIDHYITWYRRTNGTRLFPETLESVFENSILREYIRVVEGGAHTSKIALGVRYRDREDRLAEDESLFA